MLEMSTIQLFEDLQKLSFMMNKAVLVFILFCYSQAALPWVVTEEGFFNNECDHRVNDSFVFEKFNCSVLELQKDEKDFPEADNLTSESVNEDLNGSTDDSLNESVSESINESLNESTDNSLNESTDESTDESAKDTLSLKVLVWSLATNWPEAGHANARLKKLAANIHKILLKFENRPDLIIISGVEQVFYHSEMEALCNEINRFNLTPNHDSTKECILLRNHKRVVVNAKNTLITHSALVISLQSNNDIQNKVYPASYWDECATNINGINSVYSDMIFFKLKAVGRDYSINFALINPLDIAESVLSRSSNKENYMVAWKRCRTSIIKMMRQGRNGYPVTVFFHDQNGLLTKTLSPVMSLYTIKDKHDFYPDRSLLAFAYAYENYLDIKTTNQMLKIASYPKKYSGYPFDIERKTLNVYNSKPFNNTGLSYYFRLAGASKLSRKEYSPFMPTLFTLKYKVKDLEPVTPD